MMSLPHDGASSPARHISAEGQGTTPGPRASAAPRAPSLATGPSAMLDAGEGRPPILIRFSPPAAPGDDDREFLAALSPGHDGGGDGPDRPPRGRYREFLAIVQDETAHRYSGFGMTLGRAIEAETRRFARDQEAEFAGRRQSPASFADESPDVVIWEGLRVAAVLRPTAEGEFEVTTVTR